MADGWADLLVQHAAKGLSHFCHTGMLPGHGHALVAVLPWPSGNDCRRHGANVVGCAPGQLQARQAGQWQAGQWQGGQAGRGKAGTAVEE